MSTESFWPGAGGGSVECGRRFLRHERRLDRQAPRQTGIGGHPARLRKRIGSSAQNKGLGSFPLMFDCADLGA